MDGSNWRSAQVFPEPAPGGSTGDWRSKLHPDARQRIVNKILDVLKEHLPISTPEFVSELQKIAIRFEEKQYSAAASLVDYMRQIMISMLRIKNRPRRIGPMNPSMSNSISVNQNPADPAHSSVDDLMDVMNLKIN